MSQRHTFYCISNFAGHSAAIVPCNEHIDCTHNFAIIKSDAIIPQS